MRVSVDKAGQQDDIFDFVDRSGWLDGSDLPLVVDDNGKAFLNGTLVVEATRGVPSHLE